MIPHNVQTVGQSLLLECIVTTVRGITSSVDIVWSSDDVVLDTERNVSINLTTLYSASYTSTYIIPQLGTLDDGRVYSCEVVINANPLVTATGTAMLDVNGNLAIPNNNKNIAYYKLLILLLHSILIYQETVRHTIWFSL